jgi:hypothetical protein
VTVWPWRGLRWALLLAVLAHALVWKLMHQDFSWSFQPPDKAASMSTRLLESVPVSLVQAAPQAEQAAVNVPRPVPQAAPEPSQSPVSSLETAIPAPIEPKNELKEQIPLTKSTPNATDSIANISQNLDVSAGLPQSTNTQAVASPTAPPGIKLQYPPSAQLKFDGTVMRKGSQFSGSGVLNWQTDGRDYELSLEASAMLVFNRLEKSVGKLSPQGLAPIRYSSSGTGRSETATHFRPELGKIQFSNNKPDVQLLVGAQDQLSALIQLAGIIGGDPERYRIVNRIQMQVAGLSNADVWEFNLQGISDINLPAANMQALKLVRMPRNEYDAKLEVWLSPQLGYLPIRIRQSSSTLPAEDFTDLVLSKLP